MPSWMALVIADSSGRWVGNNLRFGSRVEAEGYVRHLARRWTAVIDTRVIEVGDPITHEWNDTKNVIEEIARNPVTH